MRWLRGGSACVNNAKGDGPRSPGARPILPDDSDPQRLGRAERPVRSRVPMPMLRERRAVLEDDRQAEPGECCEGCDENEGSQEDHPILNAEVVHGTCQPVPRIGRTSASMSSTTPATITGTPGGANSSRIWVSAPRSGSSTSNWSSRPSASARSAPTTCRARSSRLYRRAPLAIVCPPTRGRGETTTACAPILSRWRRRSRPHRERSFRAARSSGPVARARRSTARGSK
jgi:hypothetical protein